MQPPSSYDLSDQKSDSRSAPGDPSPHDQKRTDRAILTPSVFHPPIAGAGYIKNGIHHISRSRSKPPPKFPQLPVLLLQIAGSAAPSIPKNKDPHPVPACGGSPTRDIVLHLVDYLCHIQVTTELNDYEHHSPGYFRQKYVEPQRFLLSRDLSRIPRHRPAPNGESQIFERHRSSPVPGHISNP